MMSLRLIVAIEFGTCRAAMRHGLKSRSAVIDVSSSPLFAILTEVSAGGRFPAHFDIPAAARTYLSRCGNVRDVRHGTERESLHT